MQSFMNLKLFGGLIVGHGIDIVSVDRIAQVYGRFGHRFLRKFLAPEELKAFYDLEARNQQRSITFLAGRWAVKESAYKALGSRNLPFTELTTVVDVNGQPRLCFTGTAQGVAEKKGIIHTHLAISHETKYALASVILEGNSS